MSRSVVSREIWVGRARALTSLRAAVAVALLLALLVAAEPARSAPTTFTVNSTGDENDLDYPDGTFDGSSDGTCDVNAGTTGDQCTLRAAIQEANATTDADTMNFNIATGCDATSGVCTITPASELPAITEQATINGYTQSGPTRTTSLWPGTAPTRSCT